MELLRDYPGTEAECKKKCESLGCGAFIRLKSNGKCYFRKNLGTTSESKDRDCFVRQSNFVIFNIFAIFEMDQDFAVGCPILAHYYDILSIYH